MKMKPLLTCSVLALALTASASALASPDYPTDIVTDLGITCRPVLPASADPTVPDCMLCHASSAGGDKPTTPFGISMVGFGLVPGDKAALQAALNKMEAAKTDSNGNGTPDIEELKACKDPNAGASAVGYGCATGGNASGMVWIGLAALVGVALGRRRA